MASLILLVASAPAEGQYSSFVQRFDYYRTVPLNIHEISVETRGAVELHDITYAGGEGRVPAYLVIPAGQAPFGAIFWGHWMMEGSPYKNRKEFLKEAIILANSGAVSLLIDAPMIRRDHIKRDEPFDTREDVIDLRRGVDLLLARKDVDPARIVYVRHSFHAGSGAILAGVDKRIEAFVLMAGEFDYFQALVSQSPDAIALRRKVPLATLRQVFEEYRWANPCRFVQHAAPATVLLQDGTHDQFMTLADIKHYNQCVSSPKEEKMYDAGHALNPEAAMDPDKWLAAELHLKPLDLTAIASLPQLR